LMELSSHHHQNTDVTSHALLAALTRLAPACNQHLQTCNVKQEAQLSLHVAHNFARVTLHCAYSTFLVPSLLLTLFAFKQLQRK